LDNAVAVGDVAVDHRGEELPLHAQGLRDVGDAKGRSGVEEAAVIGRQVIKQVEIGHAASVEAAGWSCRRGGGAFPLSGRLPFSMSLTKRFRLINARARWSPVRS